MIRYLKWLFTPSKFLYIREDCRIRMDIFPSNWAAYTEMKVKTWFGVRWKYCTDKEWVFGYFDDGTTIEEVKNYFGL